MENIISEKYTAGFGLSLFIASILNALLVVFKETNASLFSWMKSFTGHHWKTQGLIVIVLFIVLGFILSNLKLEEKLKLNTGKISALTLSGTVIGTLIIAVFYAVHV